MLSQFPEAIRTILSERLNCKVKAFSLSSGGCINNGGRLKTSRGDFFVKWNDAVRFPDMFEAEAHGLQLLASTIRTPKVFEVGEIEAYQYLVLEMIEQRNASTSYWRNFGEQLAKLHLTTQDYFGLEKDNYIGSLPQYNQQHKDWITFFINERLKRQVELAAKSNRISKEVEEDFLRLYQKLPGMLPTGRPSLVHGDLWSGNLIEDEFGEPCAIDPAIYYGHREIEIAFTKLFGGFDKAFYDSYNASWALEKGFEDRVAIYNLYPLLVHVNLFGGGYVKQVVSILKHFV